MKHKLITLCFVAVMFATIAPQIFGISAQQRRGREDELPERDELRQSYQLSPGAQVEVSSISGSVEIETASTTTAEVHIIRSARSRADLEYRRIIVEATGSSLIVRGEQEKGERRTPPGVDVRQRVVLKIPRQVNLATKSVSGSVAVGDIDGEVRVSSISGSVGIGDVNGQVQVSSISGQVNVGQAVGHFTASSVSGSVTATIKRLSEQGVRIKSISGQVELRFTDELNAELEVSSISGRVYADVPNVTVQGKLEPANFRARIGSGGALISISSISGGVRLARPS